MSRTTLTLGLLLSVIVRTVLHEAERAIVDRRSVFHKDYKTIVAGGEQSSPYLISGRGLQ